MTSAYCCAFNASRAALIGLESFLDILAFLPEHSAPCARAAGPLHNSNSAASTDPANNRVDTLRCSLQKSRRPKAAARVFALTHPRHLLTNGCAAARQLSS